MIEDDLAILESLSEFLDGEGYQPRQATNGMIALELLREMDPLPSAILLDLMMPVMDGAQFRAYQEQDPRIAAIPVILMSADHQVEIKRLRIGALECVRKPLDIDVLSQMLDRMTSRSL